MKPYTLSTLAILATALVLTACGGGVTCNGAGACTINGDIVVSGTLPPVPLPGASAPGVPAPPASAPAPAPVPVVIPLAVVHNFTGSVIDWTPGLGDFTWTANGIKYAVYWEQIPSFSFQAVAIVKNTNPASGNVWTWFCDVDTGTDTTGHLRGDSDYAQTIEYLNKWVVKGINRCLTTNASLFTGAIVVSPQSTLPIPAEWYGIQLAPALFGKRAVMAAGPVVLDILP